MTAVFNAIRSLDALLDRGDLTPEEYARRRAMIMQNIEDAEAELIDVTPVEVDVTPVQETAQDPQPAAAIWTAEKKTGSSALGLGFVVVLGVMGVCIALTLLFLPNMNLALTLGVTILAALCVALLQTSDD